MDGQMRIDAAKLKRLREIRAWSQEQLAEASGVSLRTIQRAEAQGKASRETKVCLAAALGVSHIELEAQTSEARMASDVGSMLSRPVATDGALVPVPRIVRLVSGVMALVSAAMLLGALWAIQGHLSMAHLVFLAPLAATLWAAYVAIRGGVPRTLLLRLSK